jgi:putative ECF transporter S component (TIGR02185 family)
MKKINYLPFWGYVALYVVTVFATAFLGYLSPYAWVFFPVIAALLGAFYYYLAATRWQKFGVGTIFAFILAAFLLAVGECDLPETLLILTAGVVSDVVRQLIGYNTLKGQTIAYPIQAIGVIAWLLPLWTRTEWYYQGAAEELGVEYAKGLMTFASPWGLTAVVLTTAIAGLVGILFAARIMKDSNNEE